MPENSEQVSLLKRQAYLVALPVTLLAVLLTYALDVRNTPNPFNQVALPLLAAVLLSLTLLLYLRRVPLRWIEHGLYLVAAATFLAKFSTLAVGHSLNTLDSEMTQVYIWAPFVYLLGSLIFSVRRALSYSLWLYALSLLVGLLAFLSGGLERSEGSARLAEFYLATALWMAMLYLLGTLRTRLSLLQTRLSEMERLAHRDALTGLGNRRQMEARLEQETEHFQRSGLPWAVILLDIDNFKEVNDTYGHGCGDHVLRQAAGLLQRELRDTDQLGRWGGEEFLILASQTDLSQVRVLAERLRSLLEQHKFESVGRITASFGAAAYRDGESLPNLIRRADAALYRAKQGGKNRVEVAFMMSGILTLPQLRSPFPPPPAERHPEVGGEVSAWLETFGLGPQDARLRYAFAASFVGLAAALHPQASQAALRLTADWYSLMFLHDDRCDSSGIGRDPAQLRPFSERLLSIVQGSAPGPEDEPFAHALADLRSRLRTHGGAPWLDEVARRIGTYFDALLWEAGNRASDTVPDLDAYLRLRPVTAGLKIDAAFIETVDGVRLPPAVRDHPAVRRLGELADRAVCWSNDILSLEKELQEGDVHNLVLVLMQAKGLSTEEALSEAARMYHEEIEEFLAGEQGLPSFGTEADEQLRQYVQLLKARVGGILAWSRRSRRYGMTGD